MSRSDPKKRKIKQSQKTLLAFGEGQTERAFIKHLVFVYNFLSGVSVDVDYAGGKGPHYIISKAINKKDTYKHDRGFILLDTDKECSDADKNLAKVNGLELIFSSPCLEGEFIKILEPKLVMSNWDSQTCKDYFEKKYISRHKKIVSSYYRRKFSKDLLEFARKKHNNLNRMILFIENKIR